MFVSRMTNIVMLGNVIEITREGPPDRIIAVVNDLARRANWEELWLSRCRYTAARGSYRYAIFDEGNNFR
jgi:hypothetical protein